MLQLYIRKTYCDYELGREFIGNSNYHYRHDIIILSLVAACRHCIVLLKYTSRRHLIFDYPKDCCLIQR